MITIGRERQLGLFRYGVTLSNIPAYDRNHLTFGRFSSICLRACCIHFRLGQVATLARTMVGRNHRFIYRLFNRNGFGPACCSSLGAWTLAILRFPRAEDLRSGSADSLVALALSLIGSFRRSHLRWQALFLSAGMLVLWVIWASTGIALTNLVWPSFNRCNLLPISNFERIAVFVSR